MSVWVDGMEHGVGSCIFFFLPDKIILKLNQKNKYVKLARKI